MTYEERLKHAMKASDNFSTDAKRREAGALMSLYTQSESIRGALAIQGWHNDSITEHLKASGYIPEKEEE